jgi:integrase
MAAKLEKTKTPGIYKRGSRYVFSYRVDGRQRWESARTLDEARRAKSARQTDIGRGEFEERSRITLHDYAAEWVDRYQGTGRRGFREETRAEYRGLLDKYALRHFARSLMLGDIAPRGVADFIGWLVKQPNGRGGTLSDKSVRNTLGPLMACLATAKREGLIRDNPAVGAALPHRPRIEEDDELPRPFPQIDGVETMELVVALVHPSHRLMFALLAATGLRRSELLALEVRHLHLSGASPHVKVRQRTRWQKGQGQVLGPLKSRYARRDLPISPELADRLAGHVAGREAGALVFSGPSGRPYDPHHLHLRVLVPACAEAGVEWAGFHTFRHTVATRMFATGRNAVQVQHWLGHHSAATSAARSKRPSARRLPRREWLGLRLTKLVHHRLISRVLFPLPLSFSPFGPPILTKRRHFRVRRRDELPKCLP